MPWLSKAKKDVISCDKPGGGADNSDSPSSGERTGNSPNRMVHGPCGVIGPRHGKNEASASRWKYAAQRVRPPYAKPSEAQWYPE